jgi:hypothetical protein
MSDELQLSNVEIKDPQRKTRMIRLTVVKLRCSLPEAPGVRHDKLKFRRTFGPKPKEQKPKSNSVKPCISLSRISLYLDNFDGSLSPRLLVGGLDQ